MVISDSRLLSQAGENLRLIASFGTGVDNIDLKTARQRGITVTNTPGVLTEDTADMTMALILSVVRRIGEGRALMDSGEWRGWSPTALMGGRLAMVAFVVAGTGLTLWGNQTLFDAVAVSGTASMFLTPVLVVGLILQRPVALWGYGIAFGSAMLGALAYFVLPAAEHGPSVN